MSGPTPILASSVCKGDFCYTIVLTRPATSVFWVLGKLLKGETRMAGVLKVLSDHGFECYNPNTADAPIIALDDDAPRPVYRPFETPAPGREQIAVGEPPPTTRPLFRYFLDGSMRTTNAGHVVDTKQRFLPIFIAQIGVAATRIDNARIAVEAFKNRNVFFIPETFSIEDVRKARRLVQATARSSRLPLDLDLECYGLDEDEKPIDGARKKVLSTMHAMEIDLITELADSRKLMRDSLLMIDGSLQFYGNLERAREAFHNVVGVAKSFDFNQRIGTGSNAKEVGVLVAGLRHRYRTPARKISHRNLTIGAWYLRLHSRQSHANLAITDGVVKIEIFPDNPTSSEPELHTDRCNLISKNVLALRHPTTPWTDSRWASHLYPIHLTEQYIKTRLRSDRAIRACL